jgi:hypothetical protein
MISNINQDIKISPIKRGGRIGTKANDYQVRRKPVERNKIYLHKERYIFTRGSNQPTNQMGRGLQRRGRQIMPFFVV